MAHLVAVTLLLCEHFADLSSAWPAPSLDLVLEIDNPAKLINRGNGVRELPQHDERIWKYPLLVEESQDAS
jgi:hypothetical protein